MPPKPAASKKTVEKDKKKKIEDKTFGLKNKNKSKKVANFVKTVEQQVANSAMQNKNNAKAAQAKKEKEAAEAAKKELEAALGKQTIVQPKLALGVDPKSVVCEFFRHNQCQKGNRCKFAHDLGVERKGVKIDIYTDRRKGGEEEKKNDNMEDWDDEKLKTVVENKRSAANKKNQTDIICKYFLDAIESKKYGWFWECPNGGEKCAYKHCLPEGYQLKKKKNKGDEEEEEIPIEELIEEERAKLTKHTPVTLETFKKWKEEKKLAKEKAEKEADAKRQADIKSGKTSMSGREMFVYNPDLFIDDDSAIDVKSKEYERTEEEKEADFALANNINQSLFIADEDDIPDMSDEDEDDEEEEDEEEDDEEDGGEVQPEDEEEDEASDE